MISIRITSNVPSGWFLKISTAFFPSTTLSTFIPNSSSCTVTISAFSSLSSARRTFTPVRFTFSEKPVSDLLHSLSVISRGISTVKVVPSCFLLCTEMVPPIISTYFFTIAIPSPAPWYCVLASESSCANSSKISFVNSSLMPIPVSEMR